MRCRFAALVGLALLVLVAGAIPAGAGEPGDSGAQEVLAVLHSGGGTFAERGAAYRLTLEDVDGKAAWFSDRPARDAGSYSIDELDRVFFAGDDPPNGALEVFSGKAAGAVIILELFNPRYQENKDRLVLDARVLAEDEITGLDGLASRATDDVPSRFGPAAVFLDSSCTVPNPNTDGAAYVEQLPAGITCAMANEIVDAGLCGSGGDVSVGGKTWFCDANEPGYWEFYAADGTNFDVYP